MYQVRFPQQSNAADWIDTIELTSEDDGSLIDLTGWTVTMQVWPQSQRGVGTGNYAYQYFNGNSQPILEASIANGKITIPSTGVIQWTFRASDMSNLAPATYEVGMILTKSPDTVQIVLGQLPIVSGAFA